MKMVDCVVKDAEHTEKKILGIAHCNCPERAAMVRNASGEIRWRAVSCRIRRE